ncbi:MAG: helix-turn-helix transcriptional regulator [Brevundimonas sp.]|nr:helix-turn-helix transcriptional regulator [Brevundimonas sp.]
MPSSASPVPILRYSTGHLPPDARYEAWLTRDWPRTERVYRTAPTEPFNVLMESAPLGQLLFLRTEITAMTWERREQDIRVSDFQPIIVNMMVRGAAKGVMDGRAFVEPSGSYHFHDLGRPSIHGSTASLTYSLFVPRELAAVWFSPVERLHGLVIDGDAAAAAIDLAQTVWRMLPTLTHSGGVRFERAFLELLAIGAEQAVPSQPDAAPADEGLRDAAIDAIEHRLGLQGASAAELSRVLKVPVAELTAAFRGDGGLAVWLLARRLDAARVALTGLERVEPIGNIAHRLGFSDAAHLSRAFRQRFGLSPRDYRKMKADPAPRL